MRKKKTIAKAKRAVVRRKKRAEKRVERLPLAVEREAYSLPEFCRSHRISRSLYYLYKKRGIAPVETQLTPKGKILITRENAKRWRDEHGRAVTK